MLVGRWCISDIGSSSFSRGQLRMICIAVTTVVVN